MLLIQSRTLIVRLERLCDGMGSVDEGEYIGSSLVLVIFKGVRGGRRAEGEDDILGGGRLQNCIVWVCSVVSPFHAHCCNALLIPSCGQNNHILRASQRGVERRLGFFRRHSV